MQPPDLRLAREGTRHGALFTELLRGETLQNVQRIGNIVSGKSMYWQRLQALWAALSAHLQGLPIPGNWGFCARRPLHSSGGVTVYSGSR